MSKKQYDEVSVTRILSKNRGVNITKKVIVVDERQGSVGNGTWGKIDYLCKQHGYSYRNSSSKLENVISNTKVVEDETIADTSLFGQLKSLLHPAKINLASMTKSAMRTRAIG